MHAFRNRDTRLAQALPLGLFLTALLAPQALAQGFGPDPFRPFNNQYDAYVYPIGPAGAGGTGTGGGYPASRGANQFQDYLNELQGSGRQRNEKYGIGVPYYRSSVDPAYSRKSDRDYQPNRASQRTFEETQQLIADKYLAFMAEKDPKKRTELFRAYDRARRQSTRAMTARRESPARIMDQARRVDPTSATRKGAKEPSDPAALLREKRSARPSATGGRSIPPAPSLSRSATGSSTSRSPSETLERARALELGSERATSPAPAPRSPRGSARPAPPSLD